MKTFKLIMAVVAILLFSNLLYAENPDIVANKMVTKLSKDVILTDSQKIIIQAKATEFAIKLQNASSITDSNDKQAFINVAFKEYKQNVDSLLTLEQRGQLVSKRNERRKASQDNLKSKKNK